MYFHIPPCFQKDLSWRRRKYTKMVTIFTSIHWSQKEKPKPAFGFVFLGLYLNHSPRLWAEVEGNLRKKATKLRICMLKLIYFWLGIHYSAKQLPLDSLKVCPRSSMCSTLGRKEHVLCSMFFTSWNRRTLEQEPQTAHKTEWGCESRGVLSQ